jgi:ABC-type polysaccharide/polyol phosphate export permease
MMLKRFATFMMFLTMVGAIFLIIENKLTADLSSLVEAVILVIIFCLCSLTAHLETRFEELERKLDDILFGGRE